MFVMNVIIIICYFIVVVIVVEQIVGFTIVIRLFTFDNLSSYHNHYNHLSLATHHQQHYHLSSYHLNITTINIHTLSPPQIITITSYYYDYHLLYQIHFYYNLFTSPIIIKITSPIIIKILIISHIVLIGFIVIDEQFVLIYKIDFLY